MEIVMSYRLVKARQVLQMIQFLHFTYKYSRLSEMTGKLTNSPKKNKGSFHLLGIFSISNSISPRTASGLTQKQKEGKYFHIGMGTTTAM